VFQPKLGKTTDGGEKGMVSQETFEKEKNLPFSCRGEAEDYGRSPTPVTVLPSKGQKKLRVKRGENTGSNRAPGRPGRVKSMKKK